MSGFNEPDDSGEYPEVGGMQTKRAALTAAVGHFPSPGPNHGDTLPPSPDRHFVERDETIGLVSLLFHAQQAMLVAVKGADEARDANDEELALFLEEAQRESYARAERAKPLLLTRLQAAEARRDSLEPRTEVPTV